MNALARQMISDLHQNEPDFEIYSSFDAIPLVCKSKSLFVVLSMEKVCFSTPFRDSSGNITPFTADFRVSVLTPIANPCETLKDFFYTVIVPRMQEAGYLLCEMKAEEIRPDYKLQKLVYGGYFRVRGVQIPDEQEADS